jgi:hypothetical protein
MSKNKNIWKAMQESLPECLGKKIAMQESLPECLGKKIAITSDSLKKN